MTHVDNLAFVMNLSWHKWFMEFAKVASIKSKDPSTKVGAVIVKDLQVISHGYNGFPRGVHDYQERLDNRDERLMLTEHAERNAIDNAARHGIGTLGSTIYVYPFPPCHGCSQGIIQAGIRMVVFPYSDEVYDPEHRWYKSWRTAFRNFQESGVKCFGMAQDGTIVKCYEEEFDCDKYKPEDNT